MRIALLGSTGTVGAHVAPRLASRAVDVVPVTRATGADLLTGRGVAEAFAGVDAVIDAANPYPVDDSLDVPGAAAAAARTVTDACAAAGVGHLVHLTICNVDDPAFDAFPYYVGKRAAQRIVAAGAVPFTMVAATQFHEFATNPSAVRFADDEVVVADWEIQPIAAATVAEVLVDAAFGAGGGRTHAIAGPEVIRLPELTRRVLTRRGDPRPVRTVDAALDAMAKGGLLAPPDASILGPDVDAWLEQGER